ncbi:MAG: AAA family ATPase [Patescibacteria group bacterium]|jgi:predicted kinase|nr:AAA family ATPase [Patescibacteria group bacterium]
MSMLIILRGYPGVGKTTIGKILEKDGVAVFIDHNLILNFIASIVGNDDDIYEEIHTLEKSMTNKILKNKKSAIVARGFCDTARLNEYIDISNKIKLKTVVIKLVAPKSILSERVQSLERLNDFNPTVTPDKIIEWMVENPLEPFEGEYTVDTSKPINGVIKEIKLILLNAT